MFLVQKKPRAFGYKSFAPCQATVLLGRQGNKYLGEVYKGFGKNSTWRILKLILFQF
jgi:hypothetical protein